MCQALFVKIYACDQAVSPECRFVPCFWGTAWRSTGERDVLLPLVQGYTTR